MQIAINLDKASLCHYVVERKCWEIHSRQREEAERLTDEREKVYLEILFLSFNVEVVSKYFSLIKS